MSTPTKLVYRGVSSGKEPRGLRVYGQLGGARRAPSCSLTGLGKPSPSEHQSPHLQNGSKNPKQSLPIPTLLISNQWYVAPWGTPTMRIQGPLRFPQS